MDNSKVFYQSFLLFGDEITIIWTAILSIRHMMSYIMLLKILQLLKVFLTHHTSIDRFCLLLILDLHGKRGLTEPGDSQDLLPVQHLLVALEQQLLFRSIKLRIVKPIGAHGEDHLLPGWHFTGRLVVKAWHYLLDAAALDVLLRGVEIDTGRRF